MENEEIEIYMVQLTAHQWHRIVAALQAQSDLEAQALAQDILIFVLPPE